MMFHATALSLVVTVVVAVAAVGCCCVSWHRSGYTRSSGILEFLRFTIVGVVLLILNQPEILRTERPVERPTLLVLHDTSGSMQTREAGDPRTSAVQSVTRAEAAGRMIRQDFWEPLAAEFDVIVDPFSSPMAEPEQATDLAAALQQASARHPHLRGIVLISDGDWNTGAAPATAAGELRLRGIPVFAVGMGSEERLPDIELTGLNAPTFGVAGKTVRFPFRIHSWLPQERELTVSLTGTAGTPVEKRVRVPGMGTLQETLEWRPDQTGEFQLRLEVPVDEAEISSANNSLSFPFSVRNEALQVLLVESYPRWEYRYLRNALERDPGVAVDCLLFHPDLETVGGGRNYLDQFPDEQQLFEYDVVFLGDVGVDSQQLTRENCAHLRQLVRSQAGGLVFLPGFRGRQSTLLTTELEELYPVIPDPASPGGIGTAQSARYALTESGRRSLLTRLEPEDGQNERVWRELPGFQWYAATLRARLGSEVLVTHSSDATRFGRVPLIVTKTYGTGKVLFMGSDGAWRWRKGVEDLYHYRFWGQVVRWMAYQRNMSRGESMRLFYSPDRPQSGRMLTLNANVLSPSGEPLHQGTVLVRIVTPSGQTNSLRLTRVADDSWGLFSGTFIPREGGIHHVTTTCAETGASLETDISIDGPERERVGQPSRLDVLQEVATISRGRMLGPEEAETLLRDLSRLPEQGHLIHRIRLWSHPAWAGLIVSLLATFWIGRKLAGLA